MNKTIKEALELINSLKRELVYIEGVDIIVCPPYTALSDASEILMDSNIKLGAQDVYWEHSGAFTGEVSALMLKDVACEYVILGHSERRKYFFETDEAVNKKIKTSLSVGLTPICCVGETLDEREEEKTFDIIERQLQGALKGLSQEDMSRLIIAYEPVWAIGTGKTATPAQAEEVHKFIRTWLESRYSYQTSQDLRILYGGSVKPSNTKELMQENDIDGALVGGASLESTAFIEIVKNAI